MMLTKVRSEHQPINDTLWAYAIDNGEVSDFNTKPGSRPVVKTSPHTGVYFNMAVSMTRKPLHCREGIPFSNNKSQATQSVVALCICKKTYCDFRSLPI